MTMYLASEKTKEDSIVLSEEAAAKLVSPLLKKVTIIVNDNDILLNLYGDDNIYKTFPDIGEYVKGRIICVFGCGGDRDKTKRPIMGEISGKLADITIVTSDNPRTEVTITYLDRSC